MRDPLDEALGLPPQDREPADIVVPSTPDPQADYEFARRNLYRLIGKAEYQLDELGSIAEISQQARAYEVYSNLLKTTIEANKELMGLSKDFKELARDDSGPKVVNQNLIMTSDEVLRLLKGSTE